MIKKIFFLLGVLICGVFTKANANLEKPKTDRKPVKSCIDLSNQFEKLVKNGTPLPSPLYTESHQESIRRKNTDFNGHPMTKKLQLSTRRSHKSKKNCQNYDSTRFQSTPNQSIQQYTHSFRKS